jgi:hypothetical protein
MSRKRVKEDDGAEAPQGGVQVEIVEQQALREEEFFRASGVRDTASVVVKGHVFRVDLGAKGGARLPSDTDWTVELAYDGEEKPRKLVPVVKAAPVTAVQKAGPATGQVSFACKLTVLTSQHEGLFFRVLFHGVSARAGALEAESHPIRVISKPESAAKKKRGRGEEEEEAEGGEAKRATSPSKVAKLNEAERVLEEVSQLQLETLELLRRLEHYASAPAPGEALRQGTRKHLDFGACFSDLLEAYGRLVGQGERERRARHVVSLLPSVAPLHELKDISTAAQGKCSIDFFVFLFSHTSSGGGSDMGRFGGGAAAYENSASMVTFNDVFVAVQPTPARTTTVSIDGHDFDILDFGMGEEAGCTCTNCNWKIESERMEAFTAEIKKENL